MAFFEDFTKGEKNLQILKYLDKNYYVKEKKFFRKHDDVHEWGRGLTKALSTIFSFDIEFCEANVKFWANNKGLHGQCYDEALGPRKLKCEWSPEMAQDLAALHGIQDAEENLIRVLSDQIAAEVDAQILRDLRGVIKTPDEFISLVKCVGYEPGQAELDGMTFIPKMKFVTMNYNDIRNERQNNTHWQDWVRAREQDKET